MAPGVALGVVIVAKFIELHVQGCPIMVNLDHVEQIVCHDNGSCTIYQCFTIPNGLEQDFIMPDESYEKVRTIIGSSQGGIPMEPGRMY